MLKITLKTSRPLAKYLPRGTSGTKTELRCEQGSTALDVISRMGMPPEINYLLTLNGTIVPMSQRETTVLSDHDEITILPPLKGG